MKEIELLLLAPHYRVFIKDQIEELSNSINSIYVLINFNPFVEFINSYNINFINSFTIKSAIDLSDKPTNIKVIPISSLYTPWSIRCRMLKNLESDLVYKYIKQESIRPRLMHSHFIWISGFVGTKLKEKLNVPLVITAHGFDIYSLPFVNNQWRNQILDILKKSDYIITVSYYNKKIIDKFDINIPIKVIPNGFREDLFYSRDSNSCRALLGLPKNKKIILAIGNLLPIKGHIHLVNCIRHIVKIRKDILCIIVGQGKLKNALNNEIKKYKLADYVMLLGGRTHNEIPFWINACDLFVLPSLMEGNPTVMFEALGCGKPIVATRVGGIPEIIINDKLGILVEPKDPDDLARAILRAMEIEWDTEYIREYAEQFTWHRIAEKVLRVYEEAIK